jgi:predicted dehydrogenase/threonine dehydrogenase-like Zn-dependent dehydrogenase
MEHLTQKLKSGEMRVLEVPLPAFSPRQVLVKNYYSLISAGTEGSTVKTARSSIVTKAKERPQQVKQVLDTLRNQGPVQTYRAVMKKLDAYSPLGYSCVGKVLAVGGEIQDIRVGDLVACAGNQYAYHAEVVAVPRNLVVKLPTLSAPDLSEDNYLQSAAYNTLGAIALQSIRQADLRLGETCAVIGLGLLGQLSCLMLQASGVRVVGIDVDQKMVDMATGKCVDLALKRNSADIVDVIANYTGGVGCDAVIIAAGTNSLDPINFAGAIARKKGSVVVLGAAPTGFDREPHYYRKELNLKMSCSYGPGRYDPEYEEKGLDYPVAYVRWTENRNMLAFQQLIASGKIDITYLTTHTFDLEDSTKAYDMIVSKSELFVGILIRYDSQKEHFQSMSRVRSPKKVNGVLGIGFIGAGSYAQSFLLPNIPKSGIALRGVMTSSSASARTVADRFGFEFCSTSESDILGHPDIKTIFVATRHNSHGEFVIKGLQHGQNIFVEKPLCLRREELEEIRDLTNAEHSPHLMVGFNRRFSPLTAFIKSKITVGPMAMLYRVNAGAIPADSWIQDRTIGGGRIHGEICHFVDYLIFMNGSLPKSVCAQAIADPAGLNDTLIVSLCFENGSIGSIQYFSNGSKSMPKEYFEVHAHGQSAVMHDYRQAVIYSGGKPINKKLFVQDKGQAEEVRLFIEAIQKGLPTPVAPEDILRGVETCFAIEESIRSGQTLPLN